MDACLVNLDPKYSLGTNMNFMKPAEVLLILNGTSGPDGSSEYGLRQCLQATARGNRIFGECIATIFLVDKYILSTETEKLKQLLMKRDKTPSTDNSHLFNFFA
jgi:hypothetical protein